MAKRSLLSRCPSYKCNTLIFFCLAQRVKLLTCSWEVPFSKLSWTLTIMTMTLCNFPQPKQYHKTDE